MSIPTESSINIKCHDLRWFGPEQFKEEHKDPESIGFNVLKHSQFEIFTQHGVFCVEYSEQVPFSQQSNERCVCGKSSNKHTNMFKFKLMKKKESKVEEYEIESAFICFNFNDPVKFFQKLFKLYSVKIKYYGDYQAEEWKSLNAQVENLKFPDDKPASYNVHCDYDANWPF
jgi:hypothetical protein